MIEQLKRDVSGSTLPAVHVKNALVALAAIGAMAGASAQSTSTVTLFGVTDVWLGSKKTEVGGVGTRQSVVDTSGVYGSRWGLKGSEDLGGGLKAVFILESGVNQDTGASFTSGGLFDRQGFVGLQGDFGTISFGRQYSAYDDVISPVDHNMHAFSFSVTGAVAANGMTGYVFRVNNSIKFQSAKYNGFSTTAVYGLGEDKHAAAPTFSNRASDSASVNLMYTNGPLLVGYAHQEDKKVTAAGAEDANKYDLIGGSYNFGVAKLVGSYNQAKNNTTKDKEYQFGVTVPIGAASISVGHAHSQSEAPGINNKGRGFAVLGVYDLSKRTSLYAGAVSTRTHVLNAAAETKTSVYGLGIRHTF